MNQEEYRFVRARNGEAIPHVPVSWLPSEYMFFQIPRSVPIPGNCIGMDAASAAAVCALQLERLAPGECVWDMCAAPGMKSLLMADLVAGRNVRIVATDISEHRLRVFRNIARDQGMWPWFRENVFLASQPPVLFEQHILEGKKRLSKKRKSDLIENLVSSFPASFARVLVDAECSHDGSTRHVEKHAEGGFWDQIRKKKRYPYDDPENYAKLILLQKQLILAGFHALSPGGILVYSTCSLDPEQNEKIVQFLLDTEKSAQLQPLPFPIGEKGAPAKRVHGECCLFDPKVSGTSGQFIAVVRKV